MNPSTEIRAAQKEAFEEILSSMRYSGREHSRLGLGAPLRSSFVKNAKSEYPMASLMHSRQGGSSGGRGGKTRLALLLSLLWVAGGSDHSSTRPASFWARLLGLDEPDDAGGRVVRSTWAELAHRGFVAAKPGAFKGDVPTYTPLIEDGSRRPYQTPRGADGDLYFRVPEALWRSGLLSADELTGPGLAMLVVALRLSAATGRQESLTFPLGTFGRDYGLSESTRKKGLRSLCDLGVLEQRAELADASGDRGHRLRKRFVYDLSARYAPPPRNQALRGSPG